MKKDKKRITKLNKKAVQESELSEDLIRAAGEGFPIAENIQPPEQKNKPKDK